MKTKTKVFVLALCAVLLVVSTVFVTMAFLTSQDTVQNTFSVGDVTITLDEQDVDDSETNTTTDGRDKGNQYHLIPGKQYTKDPIIHVDSDSEDCWLFVKLENGLQAIIAATTIEEQMEAKGWTCIDGDNNIWAYKEVAKDNDNIPVFENFKIIDTIEGTELASYADKTINVTAYAVQAEGFNDAEKTNLQNAIAAWEAAF